MPPTIEAALQSRLDHLELGDKELCKRAAVVGTAFWETSLKALGAEPSPAQAGADGRAALRGLPGYRELRAIAALLGDCP